MYTFIYVKCKQKYTKICPFVHTLYFTWFWSNPFNLTIKTFFGKYPVYMQISIKFNLNLYHRIEINALFYFPRTHRFTHHAPVLTQCWCLSMVSCSGHMSTSWARTLAYWWVKYLAMNRWTQCSLELYPLSVWWTS